MRDGDGVVLPALMTLVGLFCGVKAVISYVSETRSLLVIMIPLVVALVVALVWFAGLHLGVDRAQRTHRFSIDPGGLPQDAINHEVAHAEVGKRHGGRTVAGRVNPDGSGWVDVRLPRSAPLEHHVAVSMAGAIGEGENFWTSPHAAGDRANAEQRLAHLPPDERRRIYNAAAQVARPGFWYSGSCGAVKNALTRDGRYR